MFKNLTDRITSAILPSSSSGSAASADREKVQTIVNMGFTAEQARNALNATGGDGNVERAVEMLLSRNAAAAAAPSSNNEVIDLTGEDEQLQRAMEESLISERQKEQKKKKAPAKKKKATTAAPPAASTTRAGRAALDRLAANSGGGGGGGRAGQSPVKKKSKSPTPGGTTGTTTTTYNSTTIPTDRIKAPAPLQSKSKEEQIARCATRLAPYPLAVDTLHRALTQLKNDPSNSKYRKIDKSNPAFQRALGNVPGAEDLLLAVNFKPLHGNLNELYLTERTVDPALLWMAISSLEKTKQSDEYTEAKRKVQFAKTVKDIQEGRDKLTTKSIDEETIARAAFMSKCPTEPPPGRGAIVRVNIGDETIERRFDGDDTLRDVVHWIGGHGSLIPHKVRTTREWCLVDMNRYPVAPVRCSTDAELNRTLQVIGCWPSGKLELRESDEEWRVHGTSEVEMGAARGLGAHHHH